MVTYSGNETGNISGLLGNYYDTFKIYINSEL